MSEQEIPDDNECKGCIESGRKKYGERCDGDTSISGCSRVKMLTKTDPPVTESETESTN